MTYIHGIHDAALADLMGDKPGSLLITEAIGCDPGDHSGGNYTHWTNRGFRVIVRLNNGYGSAGTIPTSDRYADFARRCANYVAASPGCDIVVIGNEPNWSIERPGDQPIVATQYAKCFDLCYQAIKPVKRSCVICPAAIAPYNEQTGWCIDYWQTVLTSIAKCDALILHTYSRGPDPGSIVSEDRMGPPYQMYYNGFRAYRDFLAVVPLRYRSLPVYITETNQMAPWLNQNNGWVQAAYAEIDRWNESGGQPIHALCLYRSNRDDEWSFTDKHGVQDDFRAAVARGYTVDAAPILPGTGSPPGAGTTPPPIEPLPPTTPTPDPPGSGGQPVPDRDIDPALLVRGVKFDFVTPPLGTDYWRMTEAFWFENAAADIGPDHHILGDVSIDGAQAAGVPLKVTWPSGDTTVTSKSEQESIVYNYDYPMSPSLNEYSIQVSDGKPSDKVSGIGMGAHGNPREHTSTWIAFELVKATVPVPPVQPQPPLPHPPPGGSPGRLLWAVNGPVSQRWGENPEFYQKRLGIPYHNGIDIAVPVGTRVIAAADGVVKWVASDPEGYGLYCRVFFPEFNHHQLVAHLSEVDVQVSQPVSQGDTLGATGNTGLSSGPHAHIETRLGTENAYLQGSFGHSNGRVDPQAVYGALGMPQQPMDGPRQ